MFVEEVIITSLLFIKEEFGDTKGVIKINENYVKKKFVRTFFIIISANQHNMNEFIVHAYPIQNEEFL
jgi:hypothetical protein